MARTSEESAAGRRRRRLLPTLALLALVPLVGDTPRTSPGGNGSAGGRGENPATAGGRPSEVLGATETRVAPRDFRLSGTLAGPLVPGSRRTLDVVIENPDGYPLEVTSISVSVVGPVRRADGRANPSCRVDDQTPNLVVERAFVGPVTVPANERRSLSALAVPEDRWPLLAMPNLPVNQDGCQNSVFPIALTGTGRVE